jgi:hypothetical protein
MPNPYQNILDSCGRLQHDVRCAVNIHAGNAVHLDNQHTQVMQFLEMLNMVRSMDYVRF